MSENTQNTLPDSAKAPENTNSNTNPCANLAPPAPNPRSLPVVGLPLPPITNITKIVPDPTTARHAEILMNAIQQGVYRPGAPIHFDNTTRYDPGIQMHDILLPFHTERHSKWPGNLKLKQIVSSFHPGTSPQVLVARVMQQIAPARVFTVPTSDETTALPYYLVPHPKATEHLYKIILQLSNAKSLRRTETKPAEKKEKPVAEGAKASHIVPHTVPAIKQATTKTAVARPVGEKQALIKKPKKVKVPTAKVPKVKKNKSAQSVTASSAAIRRKLVPNLKKSTIILYKPKIQSPADILELYSNPQFSFAYPERHKKPRPSPSAVTSSPIKQETQHVLFNDEPDENHKEEDDEKNEEEEDEEDEQVNRKRPPVTLSHSPSPRRAAKKAKPSPKRAKSNKKQPKVSHSMEDDSLVNLSKGVTKRPSGRWQAQVYFAGASRYVGVYSSCQQANSAYDAFKTFLKPYKADAASGVLSRQKIHALVEEGRRQVEKDFGIDDGDEDDSIESSQRS